MNTNVHTFQLELDWELLAQISEIDRFDASWATIEKREGASLKHLKSVATVRSVGASTRIEGSQLSDDEVDVLLRQIDITKIEERDAQEVVGYFDALDLITTSFTDIEISEGNVKNLHNRLLQYCEKGEWHRGDYKQHSNAVEATLPDGTVETVFQTTEAGRPTAEAMQLLHAWYHADERTHPLVKCALYAYEFVSIHPFQDGNGRLSRLLTTLLLMRHRYTWIQYVSFEHEIEHRKADYYRVLRQCQARRPGEDVGPWIRFFFDALGSVQQRLLTKLEAQGTVAQLSPRERVILRFIEAHPGSRSGDIATRLSIPSPTVKRLLSDMVGKELLVRHGRGPGTNYSLV